MLHGELLHDWVWLMQGMQPRQVLSEKNEFVFVDYGIVVMIVAILMTLKKK